MIETNTKYRFETDLSNNLMSMSVVDARRFGVAVRKAMALLEQSAAVYRLTAEDYYMDTQAYLERMATRLEAKPREESL